MKFNFQLKCLGQRLELILVAFFGSPNTMNEMFEFFFNILTKMYHLFWIGIQVISTALVHITESRDMGQLVKVRIGKSVKAFSIDELKTLSYFAARFSDRWKKK